MRVTPTPRAELAFVVDTDPSRARHDGARSTTDYREVIGQVDAAIVAVPTVAHAEIACAFWM